MSAEIRPLTYCAPADFCAFCYSGILHGYFSTTRSSRMFFRGPGYRGCAHHLSTFLFCHSLLRIFFLSGCISNGSSVHVLFEHEKAILWFPEFPEFRSGTALSLYIYIFFRFFFSYLLSFLFMHIIFFLLMPANYSDILYGRRFPDFQNWWKFWQ